MSQIEITGLIIAVAMILFIWNRLPVVVIALATTLALWATGLVTLEQALAGFGDPSVIFIASLFVVSHALEVTGLTAAIGRRLVGDPGAGSVNGLKVTLMLLAAGLTALISASGAVAALLPIASVAAVRLSVPPSRLLLPLAFAGHAGSNLVLTGAPKNVLVSDALVDASFSGFGYFEFALVGIPLVAGTLVIVLLLGPRLLPDRRSQALPADFSTHTRVLVEQYGLSAGAFRTSVRDGSPIIGSTASDLRIPDGSGIRIVAVLDARTGAPRRGGVGEGDTILLSGDAAAASSLAETWHLAFREDDQGGGAETLFDRRSGLAEVIVPPRSALVGRRIFPGMVTESGDLVVLAIHRNGMDTGEAETELMVGDTLLVQGTWKALDKRLGTPDVLLVDSPELVRRQVVPPGRSALKSLAALIAMVLLLATGAVPPAVAGVLTASALLTIGIVSVDGAYRAINWTTVILVAAMMPLSVAMEQSGAARVLAEGLIAVVGSQGPTMLLAGLFVLTAVLGQIMSNTATTLIVIPVALAAAAGMGVSPHPVMMSLCVAGAASFMTPIATSTNLMVLGPGGYRFGDYWRLGLPLMGLYFVVAVFLVPLIWPF
jgi:di/tricarboxylate transporter